MTRGRLLVFGQLNSSGARAVGLGEPSTPPAVPGISQTAKATLRRSSLSHHPPSTPSPTLACCRAAGPSIRPPSAIVFGAFVIVISSLSVCHALCRCASRHQPTRLLISGEFDVPCRKGTLTYRSAVFSPRTTIRLSATARDKSIFATSSWHKIDEEVGHDEREIENHIPSPPRATCRSSRASTSTRQPRGFNFLYAPCTTSTTFIVSILPTRTPKTAGLVELHAYIFFAVTARHIG